MSDPHTPLEASFTVDGLDADTFRVVAAEGREGLNQLFRWRVEALVEDDREVERRGLGRPARFTFSRGDRERHVHGIVAAVQLLGRRQYRATRYLSYRIDVVPRAFQLTLRRNSRVFQEQRVDSILRDVLAPYLITPHFSLQEEYPVRAYTTQLEETDFAFLKRIAAENGLFFFTESLQHPEGVIGAATSGLMGVAEEGTVSASSAITAGLSAARAAGVELPGIQNWQPEVMVFADAATFYPTMGTDVMGLIRGAATEIGRRIGGEAAGAINLASRVAGDIGVEMGDVPALHYFDGEGSMTRPDDVVTHFSRRTQLLSNSAAHGDFDFRRPLATLRHRGEHDVVNALSEAYEALSQGLETVRDRIEGRDLLSSDFEIYRHHSPNLFPDHEHEAREPDRILRRHRREADVSEAESTCPWLSAGYRFRLADHPIHRLDDAYVPVTVHHHYTAPEETESAGYHNTFECVPQNVAYPDEEPEPRRIHVCHTATVVGDESVHTERLGMVEVRFHWDREAENSEASTCWLRVMQPWTGAGFGAQFIPRAGTEVVVTYEGGDPDKPIVLGGVYNEAHRPPFSLPEQRTKSGFRSRTIGDDEGANELSFDDAPERERVYLHAQRNLEVEAEVDRVVHIRHDDRLVVEGERHEEVRGATISRHHGRREVHVSGADQTVSEGARSVRVEEDADLHVRGTYAVHTEGGAREEHEGMVQLTAHQDVIRRIGGNLVTLVGQSEAKRSHTTHVEGDYAASSSETITLQADQAVVLRCGQSQITLGPDSIELTSPSLVLTGQDARVSISEGKIKVMAQDVVQVKADQVLLKSSGAAVGLSSEASVEGSRVLLNSPENAEDSIEQDEREPTTIVLVDEEGQPIAEQAYRIVLDDGRELAGTLDADGKAEIDIDQGGTIVFPGLRDAEEDG